MGNQLICQPHILLSSMNPSLLDCCRVETSHQKMKEQKKRKYKEIVRLLKLSKIWKMNVKSFRQNKKMSSRSSVFSASWPAKNCKKYMHSCIQHYWTQRIEHTKRSEWNERSFRLTGIGKMNYILSRQNEKTNSQITSPRLQTRYGARRGYMSPSRCHHMQILWLFWDLLQ